MRITVSDARRLGALPKKTPLTPAQRRLAKAEREKYEDSLSVQLSHCGILPGVHYERQGLFLQARDFRADFLFRAARFLVEVDGGTWHPFSHHGRGGYEKDRERDALAIINGYIVLRVTPRQVKSGQAAQWVGQLYRQRLREEFERTNE